IASRRKLTQVTPKCDSSIRELDASQLGEVVILGRVTQEDRCHSSLVLKACGVTPNVQPERPASSRSAPGCCWAADGTFAGAREFHAGSVKYSSTVGLQSFGYRGNLVRPCSRSILNTANPCSCT